jgi:4-amino-4-deoxy-L-arabinose transferase-like glycosyltransferase
MMTKRLLKSLPYYRTAFFWAIIGVAVLKVLLASTLDLGVDEVYYTTYAKKLQWSYFDHPPLVGWLIWLTTLGGALHGPIAVRLGSILLSSGSVYLIYSMTQLIYGTRSAWISAGLFAASYYTSIVSGLFVLPDTPLVFFWLLALKAGYQALIEQQQKSMYWFGLWVGCALMSKIQAGFLWIGFLAYAFTYRRSILKCSAVYLSLLISFVVSAPIWWWNFQSKAATFYYHSQRVSWSGALQPNSALREFVGEIAYIQPLVYGLVIYALYYGLKRYSKLYVHDYWLWMGIPLILTFWGLSWLRDTLPHWAGPGYISLMVWSGSVLSQHRNQSKMMRWVAASGIFTVVTLGALWAVIHFFPGTIGKKEADSSGKGDITLDLYGWKTLAQELKPFIEKDQNSGLKADVIVSNKWFPAGHIDYYVAQPLQLQLFALGDLHQIHHYAWLQKDAELLKPGDRAYFIGFSNGVQAPDSLIRSSFNSVSEPRVVQQVRQGRPTRNVYLYLLEGYLGNNN